MMESLNGMSMSMRKPENSVKMIALYGKLKYGDLLVLTFPNPFLPAVFKLCLCTIENRTPVATSAAAYLSLVSTCNAM